MNRRDFLKIGMAAPAAPSLSAAMPDRIGLGINSYCVRAMRWKDTQVLDYAAGLKMDALFLQDSLDPQAKDPAHWKEVGDYARRLGLHIEGGIGSILPKAPEAFDATVQALALGIQESVAKGSPLVRCVIASDREHLPPGPIGRHMETVVKVLRAARSRAMDAGVKIAIENHKDLQAWEMRDVITAAGREFTGSLLDTGNPLFVLEDPMTTLEVLGPYALTVHLRDSVVYEHPRGAMVQWVPLGEGVNDFRKFVARMKEICPPVYVYVKPITGRPPQLLPYLEPSFWDRYPKAKASDLARFIALAKSGRPYEKHAVIEDVAGRPLPEAFVAAMQYQQREHMERSVEYAKKTLDLGVRWRA